MKNLTKLFTVINPGGITWEPQACEDWGILQDNGHDIKHHDCDGNGFINIQDANAININYGKTHPLPPGIGIPIAPVYTNTDYQILLQPINQISLNNNTLIMNVVMDSKTNQNLSVFAGHFTIDYSGVVNEVGNVVMNFESTSWLGNPGIDLLAESWHNSEHKTIEVGFTKTDGAVSVGKGVIGKANFALNNQNNRLNQNCETLLNVALTKIGTFNAQQDSLQIEEEYQSVNLGESCCEPFINIDENTPFQNLYQSSGTVATIGYLPIGQNQQVEYRANHVRMNTGFTVKAGADFKVRSSGCN